MVDTYQHDLKKNMAAVSLTPTIIYAIISTSLNIAKMMHGPYSFLYVYEQPIWMSVMYVFLIIGIAYLIGWGLWKISRVIKEKRMECYA